MLALADAAADDGDAAADEPAVDAPALDDAVLPCPLPHAARKAVVPRAAAAVLRKRRRLMGVGWFSIRECLLILYFVGVSRIGKTRRVLITIRQGYAGKSNGCTKHVRRCTGSVRTLTRTEPSARGMH